MSDTNPAGAGDFRGSAADKRKDETVMVNADDLSNLVSSARQDPTAAIPPTAPVVPAPAAPVAAAPAGSPNKALIIGVAVVIVLVIVAIIAFVAFG